MVLNGEITSSKSPPQRKAIHLRRLTQQTADLLQGKVAAQKGITSEKEEINSSEKHNSTNSGPSPGKYRRTERHRLRKSYPTEEGYLFQWDHSEERGSSIDEDRPEGRGHPIKTPPAEEDHSSRKRNSAEREPSPRKDSHTGRLCLRKRYPGERYPFERGNSEETVHSAREHSPTGRDLPQKKSCPAQEGLSVERGNYVERGPSTWKEDPTGRCRPPKKSRHAEKHLFAEESCPPKKSCPAEKSLSSRRVRLAEKVHSGKRGHFVKKRYRAKRQLSAEKGRIENKGICLEKVYSEERGQSSQSSYTAEGNRVENGYPVTEGLHSTEKSFPVEEPSSSGSVPIMPVPNSMQNTPENLAGSGPSTVPQIPHQNVPGTVTTGQSEQVWKVRYTVKFKFSKELKSFLVQDWDLINKHKQLFQLPANKDVDTVLAEYVTFVKSQGKGDNKKYSVDELVYGIRKYFNKMLATQLLCQFEKPQYAEIHLAYPHIPMSKIYRAPHLLRLFVHIGTVLSHSRLSRRSLVRVCNNVHYFLKHLTENSTSLFSASNYKVASAEYCCKAL
ncbi:hypothetical protein U0070_015159 [Myodes glareolus]|uniref:MRG domain-containing protein n=1 Tax=Myodes glareolus TaxID=447135 RepID=A0AAW0H4L5_MYOGA